ITALVSPNSLVRRGEKLWSVDGKPVVLFVGDTPLYRTLRAGVTDGHDVFEVEQNLAALGFTAGGALAVDEHWDARTTAAVEAWQRALGVTDTGQVESGDVVVDAGPLRVGHRKHRSAGQPRTARRCSTSAPTTR